MAANCLGSIYCINLISYLWYNFPLKGAHNEIVSTLGEKKVIWNHPSIRMSLTDDIVHKIIDTKSKYCKILLKCL